MYFLIILNSFIAISALESRVFNGLDLNQSTHRHLVKLKIYRNIGQSVCSGSILSKNWIITAAHCFKKKTTKPIDVRQLTEETRKHIARVNPRHVFKNPSYIDYDRGIPNANNDIALLKTSHSITFDYYVGNIEFATVPPTFGESVVMAGYGKDESNKAVFFPRRGVTEIVECPNEKFGSLWCTYDSVKPGHGDSGGPLTYNGKLVGIISGGLTTDCISTDCSRRYPKMSSYAYYANVFAHYGWIRNVTNL